MNIEFVAFVIPNHTRMKSSKPTSPTRVSRVSLHRRHVVSVARPRGIDQFIAEGGWSARSANVDIFFYLCLIVSAEERTTFGDAETFYTASDDEKVRHNDQMILLPTFREWPVFESKKVLKREVIDDGSKKNPIVEDVSKKLSCLLHSQCTVLRSMRKPPVVIENDL